MKARLLSVAVAAAAVAAVPGGAVAQTPTTVTVRVLSHDAKIIGSGVGGARVTIRDAASGQVLAAGVQEGGTGDTRAIMVEPLRRGASVLDTPGAARFTVTLALDRPTLVDVIAEGPLDYPHAMQRAAKTVLLVPGEHVAGDGLTLTLHGFIVELLEPRDVPSSGDMTVRVAVRMLCGCPFEAGGLWEPADLTVTARVVDGARVIRTAALAYAGRPNEFAGTVAVDGLPRGARLEVVVADAAKVNFGVSVPKPLR